MVWASAATADGLPMYGNWCGPNYPNNVIEASRPPIDPLDAACYRHDVCTGGNDSRNCDCDIRFMRELRNLRYPTKDQEVIARAMYDAIAMVPCSNPMGMAYKQACVWGDLAQDFVSGRSMPWEMPMRWMYLADRTMLNKRWQDLVEPW